jgi:hypothetical protein
MKGKKNKKKYNYYNYYQCGKNENRHDNAVLCFEQYIPEEFIYKHFLSKKYPSDWKEI